MRVRKTCVCPRKSTILQDEDGRIARCFKSHVQSRCRVRGGRRVEVEGKHSQARRYLVGVELPCVRFSLASPAPAMRQRHFVRTAKPSVLGYFRLNALALGSRKIYGVCKYGCRMLRGVDDSGRHTQARFATSLGA